MAEAIDVRRPIRDLLRDPLLHLIVGGILLALWILGGEPWRGWEPE